MTNKILNEFTPLARHFFRIRNFHLQSACQGKKKSVERLIRSKCEEKAIFGNLLETSKEKRAKRKTGTQTLFSEQTIPSDNGKASELHWSLGSSTKLKIIPLVKKKSETLKNGDIVSPIIISDTELKESRSNDNINQPSGSDAKNTTNDTGSYKSSGKTNPFTQNNAELPDVVIRNLPSFSIFDTVRKSEQNPDDNKILSLSASDDKTHLCFPSVTRILNATMSEQSRLNLERWKEKMIAKLGIDGFEKHQADLFSHGKQLHAAIENTLTRKTFEMSKAIEPALSSLKDVFKDVDEVRALESHVVHPKLKYRGIVDCIASYRGTLCLIDWKKSDKLKPTVGSTYDAPLQLASYIGALNVDVNYPFQISKGGIIVAYTSGEAASVHEISGDQLQLYWRLWLQRLQKYHENKQTVV